MADDWFAQNAPKSDSGDWFSANAPKSAQENQLAINDAIIQKRQAQQAVPKQGVWPYLKQTAKGAAGVIQGVGDMMFNPNPAAGATQMTLAATDQAVKAAQAWRNGDHSEAVGHAMAAALPGVGPMAANIGEKAGSGDTTGALADATVLGGTLAAPHVGEAAKTVAKAADLPTRAAAYSRVMRDAPPSPTGQMLGRGAGYAGGYMAGRSTGAWEPGIAAGIAGREIGGAIGGKLGNVPKALKAAATREIPADVTGGAPIRSDLTGTIQDPNFVPPSPPPAAPRPAPAWQGVNEPPPTPRPNAPPVYPYQAVRNVRPTPPRPAPNPQGVALKQALAATTDIPPSPAMAQSPIEPVPSTGVMPSGRGVPGSLPPKSVPPTRVPQWQQSSDLPPSPALAEPPIPTEAPTERLGHGNTVEGLLGKPSDMDNLRAQFAAKDADLKPAAPPSDLEAQLQASIDAARAKGRPTGSAGPQPQPTGDLPPSPSLARNPNADLEGPYRVTSNRPFTMGEVTQMNRDLHGVASSKGLGHKALSDTLAMKFGVKSMKDLTGDQLKQAFRDFSGEDWYPGWSPRPDQTPGAVPKGNE